MFTHDIPECIFILWSTSSRLNHTLLRDKILSLYLRHFSVSHLHPNIVCVSRMLDSSTPPNHSPAAKHFLVDYSGFSLHSHTRTHKGLNKKHVTPIIFIVITVWECGRIRNRSPTLDSVSPLIFLDEPDCILGSCFAGFIIWMGSIYTHTHTHSSQWLSFIQDGKDFLGNWSQLPRQSLCSNMSPWVLLTFHL